MAWSCEEKSRANCRNAHGCHCREIEDLNAGATWIIVTDPGCVPDRKGPIRDGKHLAQFLRELMEARPTSHLIVARISCNQLHVDDGTQALEIIDGRSAPTARKHRARLRAHVGGAR